VYYQGAAQRRIQRALARDRLPHAYLFHGPAGVGKESLARSLAQLLLCETPVVRRIDNAAVQMVGCDSLHTGCGDCADCRSVAAGTHPDLHLVYRQLNREHPDADVRKRKALDIGVDVLRHFVIDKVGLTPHRSRAKVFIIREADRITTQAQNALLKTLEEPPDTTFLILLVSAVERMLPTVRSRCHVTRFGTLPHDFVAATLRTMVEGMTAEQAEFLARFSQESLGLALQLAQDGVSELNAKVLALLGGLAKNPVTDTSAQLQGLADELAKRFAERDEDISNTEAQRRALHVVLSAVATWYRDVLHMTVQVQEMVANAAMLVSLADTASHSTPGRAVAAIQQVAAAQTQLDRNVNTKLALDALLIRLQRLAVST
jgi:DNA polymerase-3 subunit delta'